MRLFQPSLGPLSSLAFAPHQPLLAIGGSDVVLFVDWRALCNGELTQQRVNTREAITHLAWHPTQRGLLACAGMDGVVELYSPRGRLRKQLVGLTGQHGPMATLAFSPEGEWLALGGGWWDEAGCVVIVATATWERTTDFHHHINQVGTLCFTRSTMLATGAADRCLQFDDLHAQQMVWQSTLQARVQDLALAPDGAQLAVAAGSTIRLYPLRANGVPETFDPFQMRGHTQAIRALAYSPDGSTLASVSEDATLRFWDVRAGVPKSVLDLRSGPLRSVAYAPDGLTVACTGERGTLVLVDGE